MGTSLQRQNAPAARLWDWKAALLTLALVQISSARLALTEWEPFLYFTQTMSFLGVVLGLALGYSRFSRAAAVRIAAGYTFILVNAQLLGAVERTDWVWRDIVALFERLVYSLGQFITNKPVYDHLFFLSLATLAYWLIGIFSSYWLTRHRDFLNIVLPPGAAILTVQAFDPPPLARAGVMGAFVLIALLLLARLYFLKNLSFWRKTNFLLTDETVSDLERGALAVTAVAVLAAWSLPAFLGSIPPAAQAWRDFSQPLFDRFSNAVAALEAPYAVNRASGEFYGSSLFLGKQAAKGETVVFTVKVRESGFTPIRHYWKGRHYDTYLNGRWATTDGQTEAFAPARDTLTFEYAGRRSEMEFTFTNRAKQQSLLYSPAETVWVSKNARVQSAPTDGSLKDAASWSAETSLTEGEQYKTKSFIANPTVEELRAAGTEYPNWVKERYLQIPEEIEPQLSELTLEITASQQTPYDKAQAVTTYLRNEIEYRDAIEEAPPDALDPVLWVLFELKKGFCMYYASAETLMLRSIGIPARMAVGFVEGNYDEEERRYSVAYKDSHAWSEVYFPGIGWVEFEPTSNQFPIERPERSAEADEINEELSAAESRADNLPHPAAPLREETGGFEKKNSEAPSSGGKAITSQRFLLPALLALALGFVVLIIRRYALDERLPSYLTFEYERRGAAAPRWLKRWARWTSLSPIERAFQSVNLSLYWLGKPQAAHVTSAERAKALLHCLPEAREDVLPLLEEYHNALYTPRGGNAAQARKAAVRILVKARFALIKEALQSADRRYNQLK